MFVSPEPYSLQAVHVVSCKCAIMVPLYYPCRLHINLNLMYCILVSETVESGEVASTGATDKLSVGMDRHWLAHPQPHGDAAPIPEIFSGYYPENVVSPSVRLSRMGGQNVQRSVCSLAIMCISLNGYFLVGDMCISYLSVFPTQALFERVTVE